MKNEVRKFFQKNLQALVERRPESQAEIAKALGVSTSAFSSWMTGQRFPRIDVMQRIADYFNVTLTGLTSRDLTSSNIDMRIFSGIDPTPRTLLHHSINSPTTLSKVTAEEQELLRLFRAAPKSTQDLVMKMLR